MLAPMKVSERQTGTVKDEAAAPTTSESLLSIKEVAAYWKVSVKTVRRRIRSGDLRARKIGGVVRIRPADLRALEASAMIQEASNDRYLDEFIQRRTS